MTHKQNEVGVEDCFEGVESCLGEALGDDAADTHAAFDAGSDVADMQDALDVGDDADTQDAFGVGDDVADAQDACGVGDDVADTGGAFCVGSDVGDTQDAFDVGSDVGDTQDAFDVGNDAADTLDASDELGDSNTEDVLEELGQEVGVPQPPLDGEEPQDVFEDGVACPPTGEDILDDAGSSDSAGSEGIFAHSIFKQY